MNDEELGAPIAANGQELTAEQAKDELENTTRIVAFKSDEGTTYKGKINLLNLKKYHERVYGLAQYDCAKKAGFTSEEIPRLGELQKENADDPRFDVLIEEQSTNRKILRAEATIARDVFVSWNVAAPAPTLDDLLNKGGIYAAYSEAVTSKFGPTARRSEVDAATT
jgi:hypothetical protein